MFNLKTENDLELASESLENFCYDNLPFYSMRIDDYEHRIKRYATRWQEHRKCTVTFNQLRFSFRNDPAWRDAFEVPIFCTNPECGMDLDFKHECKKEQVVTCQFC